MSKKKVFLAITIAIIAIYLVGTYIFGVDFRALAETAKTQGEGLVTSLKDNLGAAVTAGGAALTGGIALISKLRGQAQAEKEIGEKKASDLESTLNMRFQQGMAEKDSEISKLASELDTAKTTLSTSVSDLSKTSDLLQTRTDELLNLKDENALLKTQLAEINAQLK